MRHDAGSRPAPAEEPFILTAMLSLVAASLWMALRPGLFLGFFYAPELLAITHLVTVGFITAIAMGILVRLVPMVFGVEVASRRLALVQFALHLVGAAGMISHFLLGSVAERVLRLAQCPVLTVRETSRVADAIAADAAARRRRIAQPA